MIALKQNYYNSPNKNLTYNLKKYLNSHFYKLPNTFYPKSLKIPYKKL